MKKRILLFLIVICTINTSYSQNIKNAISFIEDTFYQEHLLGMAKESIHITYSKDKIILNKINIVDDVRNDNILTTIYLDDIDKKSASLELMNLKDIDRDMSGYVVVFKIKTKEKTIKVFTKKLIKPRSTLSTRKTEYVDVINLNSVNMQLPLPVAKKYARSVCDLFSIEYKDVSVKIYDIIKEKLVDTEINI